MVDLRFRISGSANRRIRIDRFGRFAGLVGEEGGGCLRGWGGDPASSFWTELLQRWARRSVKLLVDHLFEGCGFIVEGFWRRI